MTDRDHFATAALTGFMCGLRMTDVYEPDSAARLSYELADAMLRERERTHGGCPSELDSESGSGSQPDALVGPRKPIGQPFDSAPTAHDAAPAAKAPTDASPLRSAQSVTAGMGTGDTQEPVAWAVVYPNDEVGVIAFRMADANERATASDRVVPLYREPQTCPYVVGRTTLHCSLTPFTLTDAEREAIACAAESYADNDDDEDCHRVAVTLGRLLERTK